MATTKEIKEHLEMALKEIGEIKPWYDRRFRNWLFSHSAYPVEYAGDSKEEVINNYPLYLRDFIKERLNDNLNPLTEKATKGKGGKREGAGRPLGSKKEHKTRIYLPDDVVSWFQQHPESISQVRHLIQKQKTA